jgi:hypothetical protein
MSPKKRKALAKIQAGDGNSTTTGWPNQAPLITMERRPEKTISQSAGERHQNDHFQ